MAVRYFWAHVDESQVNIMLNSMARDGWQVQSAERTVGGPNGGFSVDVLFKRYWDDEDEVPESPIS